MTDEEGEISPYITKVSDEEGYRLEVTVEQLRRWLLYDLEVANAEEILQCGRAAVPVSFEGAEIEARFSEQRLEPFQGLLPAVQEYAAIVGQTITMARNHVSGHQFSPEEAYGQAYLSTVAAFAGIVGFLTAFTHVGVLSVLVGQILPPVEEDEDE